MQNIQNSILKAGQSLPSEVDPELFSMYTQMYIGLRIRKSSGKPDLNDENCAGLQSHDSHLL